MFEQVANKKLDTLGVTHAQTVILIRLWEQDGLNQMELAKSAGLDQSTVVRLLDRMEKSELITRERNKDDRRVFNFYLTDKAKVACQKLEVQSNSITEIAHESLSPSDIKKLNQLMSVVVGNLQNYLEKN